MKRYHKIYDKVPSCRVTKCPCCRSHAVALGPLHDAASSARVSLCTMGSLSECIPRS